MTQEDITRNGIAGRGDHDIEYEGDTKVIYDEITLGTYDNAADGNGNLFHVLQIYGYDRLKIVHVEVADGTPVVAQYDYINNAIRLFRQANDGTGTADDPLTEVSAGTAMNVDLRVEVRGNG